MGGRREGFVDCYGMVQFYYRFVMGIELPEVEYGKQLDPVSTNAEIFTQSSNLFHTVLKPQVHDLVGFRDRDGYVTHLGIWLGNGKILDCGKYGIRLIRAEKLRNLEYMRYNG